MKAAFLIIDVQKGYIENPDFRKTILPSVNYINAVSGFFRKQKLPVIVVQHIGGYNPGDEGFEVADEIKTQKSDISIHKTFSNSFWETDLEKILKELEVDTLILSGFAASFCVLATFNGAIERGFKPFILQHGIGGKNQASVDLLHELRSVISYDAVRLLISK